MQPLLGPALPRRSHRFFSPGRSLLMCHSERAACHGEARRAKPAASEESPPFSNAVPISASLLRSEGILRPFGPRNDKRNRAPSRFHRLSGDFRAFFAGASRFVLGPTPLLLPMRCRNLSSRGAPATRDLGGGRDCRGTVPPPSSFALPGSGRRSAPHRSLRSHFGMTGWCDLVSFHVPSPTTSVRVIRLTGQARVIRHGEPAGDLRYRR